MRRRQRFEAWTAALLFLAVALSGMILVALASTSTVVAGSEGNAMMKVDERVAHGEETATFALGCFWGADAVFGALPGVARTTVGYAGGTRENPTYYDIGDHAEAVQVVFDPLVISYEELLAVFWSSHDARREPLNSQYRSLILVHSDAQQRWAEASYETQGEAAGHPLTTGILLFTDFTRAENYHQKFHVQSEPALAGLLLARFGTFDAFVDSTLVARVNGVLGREAAIDQAESELAALGLSDTELQLVRNAIGATCEPPQVESFDSTWRAEGAPKPTSRPLPSA